MKYRRLVIIFAILLIIVASIAGFSPVSGISVHIRTDDKQVTTAPSVQSKVSLAVNPIDPSNIIIGYNDYAAGNWRASYSYSINGGNTWITGAPLPTTNLPNLAKDSLLI